MTFFNKTKGTVVADKGLVAGTAWARAKGLLGRQSLEPGEGLAIIPCDSIHMFFMRFAIDLVYVDVGFRVVKVVRNIRPWRVSFGGKKAFSVLELPLGAVDASRTEVGDEMEMREGMPFLG